jgi:hypothetical protein
MVSAVRQGQAHQLTPCKASGAETRRLSDKPLRLLLLLLLLVLLTERSTLLLLIREELLQLLGCAAAAAAADAVVGIAVGQPVSPTHPWCEAGCLATARQQLFTTGPSLPGPP